MGVWHAASVPYGAHLRLHAGVTVPGVAQVVVKALQTYGMYLADGGSISLTAQNDVFSNVKYSDLGFNASSLSALKATDFDVLDYGTPIPLTSNCTRTQITQ